MSERHYGLNKGDTVIYLEKEYVVEYFSCFDNNRCYLGRNNEPIITATCEHCKKI
jgi:hypothetical protein